MSAVIDMAKLAKFLVARNGRDTELRYARTVLQFHVEAVSRAVESVATATPHNLANRNARFEAEIDEFMDAVKWFLLVSRQGDK